jgi:hypothetical protein
MTRAQEISRAILGLLADWDEPADEAVIHAQVNNRVLPEAIVSEFNEALMLCDQMRWITGVRNPLRGTRWAITDKGRTARHQ